MKPIDRQRPQIGLARRRLSVSWPLLPPFPLAAGPLAHVFR
jgi:hypothetical protein